MKKPLKFVAIGLATALLVLASGWSVAAQGPMGKAPGLGQPAVLAPRYRGGADVGGQAGLEAMAQALEMSADDLRAALEGGKTLADLAEDKGVDLQALKDAADASRQAAAREAIEGAVADGDLTRERADWMLQGLDEGYMMGGHGRRGGCGAFGLGKDAADSGLEAAANALDMTADELSLQLWGGRTLADLAEKAGVNLEDVQSAMETARQAARRQAIEQAVTDGQITREQADWMLQGLEQGYEAPGRFPRMDGFRGSKRPGGPGPQTTPSNSSADTGA